MFDQLLPVQLRDYPFGRLYITEKLKDKVIELFDEQLCQITYIYVNECEFDGLGCNGAHR
jgi:hypothetical protein